MRSDVIRKRARHDARCASGSGNTSETPSASPGASRCASPEGNMPTLVPDSTTQSSYSSEDQSGYGGPTQTEIMSALANMTSQTQQNGHINSGGMNGSEHGTSGYSQMSYALSYSGPYHPDQLTQAFNMAAGLQYPDASDYNTAKQSHAVKCHHVSNDTGSESLSSATAYSSYHHCSCPSASSPTSHSSQRSSSLDFNFPFGYGDMFPPLACVPLRRNCEPMLGRGWERGWDLATAPTDTSHRRREVRTFAFLLALKLLLFFSRILFRHPRVSCARNCRRGAAHSQDLHVWRVCCASYRDAQASIAMHRRVQWPGWCLVAHEMTEPFVIN